MPTTLPSLCRQVALRNRTWCQFNVVLDHVRKTTAAFAHDFPNDHPETQCVQIARLDHAAVVQRSSMTFRRFETETAASRRADVHQGSRDIVQSRKG